MVAVEPENFGQVHYALETTLQPSSLARLPAGREEIVMLHLAMDGVLLDRLTAPDALGIEDLEDTVEALTRRILG